MLVSAQGVAEKRFTTSLDVTLPDPDRKQKYE